MAALVEIEEAWLPLSFIKALEVARGEVHKPQSVEIEHHLV